MAYCKFIGGKFYVMCLPRPVAYPAWNHYPGKIIAYRYNTSFSKIGDPDPDVDLGWCFSTLEISDKL
jgi:hypothetical protein